MSFNRIAAFFRPNYAYTPISQLPERKDGMELITPSQMEAGAPSINEKIGERHSVGTDQGKKVPYSTGGKAKAFIQRQQVILGPASEKVAYAQAFKIMQAVEIDEKQVIKSNSWNDLNIIGGSKELTLANVVNRTQTAIGTAFLYCRLAKPIADVARIMNRQAAICKLSELNLGEHLTELFATLNENENDLLSFWDGKIQLPGCVQNQYIRYFTDTLNRISPAVETNAVFQIYQKLSSTVIQGLNAVFLPLTALSKTTLFQTPEFLTDYSKRFISAAGTGYGIAYLIPHPAAQSVVALAAGAASASTLKSKIEWTIADLRMDSIVQNKLVKAAKYFRAMTKVYEALKDHEELISRMEHFESLRCFMEDSALKPLISVLNSNTFNDESWFLYRHGNVLIAWDLLQQKSTEEKFAPALASMGEIDTLLSCHKLLKEHAPVHYCIPKIIAESRYPELTLINAWNPIVDPNEVVPNSIQLGASSPSKNIIITGPNTNGKSNFLRTIANACVTTQSLGIAPAEEMAVTPFDEIETSMNVSDNAQERKSLFKAQVGFMEKLFKTQLPQNERCLNILDELFSGTSAEQRAELAYKTVKKIGTLQSSASIIVTHDKQMTDLEQTGNFKNYHLSKYRIQEGVSTENNAFEVAQELLSMIDENA